MIDSSLGRSHFAIHSFESKSQDTWKIAYLTELALSRYCSIGRCLGKYRCPIEIILEASVLREGVL